MMGVDKLYTIAENEPRVFEAGKKKGYADGFEVGEAMGYTEGRIDGAAVGRSEGYAAGTQEAYDRLWDTLQNYGNEHDYTYAFSHRKWTEDIYEPKYPIRAGMANGLFQLNTKLTDTKVEVDISGANQYFYLFHSASSIITIRKLKIAETQRFTDEFTNAVALKNITVEGTIGRSFYIHYSPLTVESMKSIISCLKDYANTDSEFAYTVKFSDACWAALEASGGAPYGGTWEGYVNSLAWNT